MPVAGPALASSYGTSAPATTAGGVPLPNLQDPATRATFANQAVAGGNPYFQGPGSPQASPQGVLDAEHAAQALQQPAAPPTNLPQGLLGGPDIMTPAMQKYIGQFEQSQNAQSQALNAGLLQATQGLMQRRDAAAAVAHQLPQQYQDAYKQAVSDVHSDLAGARQAMGPAGKRMLGGNRDASTNAALLAGEKAAGASELPFLQAGITAQASQGQTALANTDMQNKEAIAQQQSAFDQQMAMAQMQYAESQQQGNQQFARDEALARLNSSLGTSAAEQNQRNQYAIAQQYGQLPQAPQTAIQQQNDQNAVSAGFPGGYQQLTSVIGSPDYSSATGALTKAGTSSSDRANALKSITNPQVLLALQYSRLITPQEVAAAQGMTLPTGVNPSYVG